MFKKLFFREKKCVNTHTIFYEDLSTFPPYLLFKAKIRGDFYGFNIIAFRRMYKLALENRKAMTNPHDPFNRKISNKIIKRAKKFWKRKSRKYSRMIIKKMVEYNYSTIQFNWPKPLPPYPKNLILKWTINPHSSLVSFNIYWNGRPLHPGHYYIPRYMEIGDSAEECDDSNIYEYYENKIDTASTTFIGIWYINQLWIKKKLITNPVIRPDGKLNIIKLFEPLLNPNYWNITIDNNYTNETFRLWIEFVENLKNQ